jgi:hypothetical protein
MYMFMENSNEKKYYYCQCGESFSSLEEFNEHFDLIIQHFI